MIAWALAGAPPPGNLTTRGWSGCCAGRATVASGQVAG